jgi:hypothetical protein
VHGGLEGILQYGATGRLGCGGVCGGIECAGDGARGRKPPEGQSRGGRAKNGLVVVERRCGTFFGGRLRVASRVQSEALGRHCRGTPNSALAQHRASTSNYRPLQITITRYSIRSKILPFAGVGGITAVGTSGGHESELDGERSDDSILSWMDAEVKRNDGARSSTMALRLLPVF